MNYYTNNYFNISNNGWFKGSNYLKLTSQPGTVNVVDVASSVSENNLSSDLNPIYFNASISFTDNSSQLSIYDFSDTLVLENIIPEN